MRRAPGNYSALVPVPDYMSYHEILWSYMAVPLIVWDGEISLWNVADAETTSF